MKKTLALLLSLLLLLVFSTTALACEDHASVPFSTDDIAARWLQKETAVYYVDSMEDVAMHEHFSLNPDQPASFIIEKTTRAVCYECGRNTMVQRQQINSSRGVRVPCPMSGAQTRDNMFELSMFYWDYCTSCGYTSPEYQGAVVRYEVHCTNGFGDEVYVVRPGATIGQGYNF